MYSSIVFIYVHKYYIIFFYYIFIFILAYIPILNEPLVFNLVLTVINYVTFVKFPEVLNDGNNENVEFVALPIS